jgi:hypothetical protein
MSNGLVDSGQSGTFTVRIDRDGYPARISGLRRLVWGGSASSLHSRFSGGGDFR